MTTGAHSPGHCVCCAAQHTSTLGVSVWRSMMLQRGSCYAAPARKWAREKVLGVEDVVVVCVWVLRAGGVVCVYLGVA